MPVRSLAALGAALILLGLVPSSSVAAEPDLAPYAGLATWLDIYDRPPWIKPERTIARLKKRGVNALFLQTSNYHRYRSVMNRAEVGRFIDAAHRARIKVIAWYVPSFENLKMDLNRSLAAIRFKSPAGRTFDSFALDIEADGVRDIAERNRRMLALSDRIRSAVGPDYPLGAVIPDPKGSRYWPGFPYKEVARRYDVIVPMAYFTYRTSGYRRVLNYTVANIRIIRRETGDRKIPIHMIGGLADSASDAELKAFVSGVRAKDVLGASLYDFPLMSKVDWTRMKAIVPRPKRTRPPSKRVPEQVVEVHKLHYH